ncbi:MAG: DUF1343 domain-containing protein [Byssovorax sp.]
MMSGLLLALGACTAAPRPEGTSSAPAPEASDARTAPPSTPPADPPAPALPPSSPRGAAAPARPGVAIHTFDEAAEGAILREEVPGAVILVIQRGEVVHRRAYGLRRKEPSATPMTVDTVFDLASLTKAICTGPSIMLLAEQHKLHIGDRVSKYLPSLRGGDQEAITLEQLLLHTSGLPADNALIDYDKGPDHAIDRIASIALVAEPGSRFEYSDLGYILLGKVVEAVSGQSLDAFVQDHFFGPLGMKDTAYRPGPALAARAAPTEEREGSALTGKVHDPRAARLGGVAGHAGLFSTADDLGRFARMLLGGGKLGEARVLGEATVREMTRPRPLPGGGSRGLGWDIDSPMSGQRGDFRSGFGHTGFTGTSIWIDPSTGSAVIVLTSRLYPDGKGDARRLRREVASLAAHLDPASAAPRNARVLTGLDVLEREGFARLAGRTIGLVTHAAAVDRDGKSCVDRLLAAPGVKVAALFAPEHGLRSEQDRPLDDGRDPASGLPIYSLYGERKRPSDASLAGLDALVVDLQDAGARFYTYETTLGYLLETAAAKKIALMVLDRPNPLGGTRVEGPLLDPDRRSFTGYHPLPVRHGMTLGELARLFNAERSIGAALAVVPLEGWSRADDWARTGLAFHPPSPNLRTPDEVTLYPGIALLEATNLSVGRGTARPFEQVGAPFIDGPALASALAAEHLPGLAIQAISFTPSSSTFAGQPCHGVALALTDRARFDPVRAGLSIAAALRRLYPTEWQIDGLMTLLGNRAAFAAIAQGKSAAEAEETWRAALADFRSVRSKHLLYR